jgi:hypothetical protein
VPKAASVVVAQALPLKATVTALNASPPLELTAIFKTAVEVELAFILLFEEDIKLVMVAALMALALFGIKSESGALIDHKTIAIPTKPIIDFLAAVLTTIL